MTRDVIKSVVIVSLIMIFVVSTTYAYMYTQTNINNQTGTGGCFQVNYSGTAINNSSILSTNDYQNGAHSTITLSKGTNCKIYSEASIKIHINSGSTIPLDSTLEESNAFKYKIVKGQTEVASGTVKRTSPNVDDITLTTVTLTNTSTAYDVYLWIDSSVSAGAYHEKSFSGYFFAESIQSTTINN